MNKRRLTKEQLEECSKLKSIYSSKRKQLGLTHYKVAEALGGISAGAVSHYLNSLNPLNMRVAVIFAKLLEVKVSDFSPRLSRDLGHDDETESLLDKLKSEASGLDPIDLQEILEMVKTKKRLRGAA